MNRQPKSREIALMCAAVTCVAAVALVAAHAAAPESAAIARLHAAFTPENRTYARVREAIALIAPLWAIAAAYALVASGWSARLRDVARRAARGRWARVLVYTALAGAIVGLAQLPLAAFGDWWWERRYGLSVQTFPAWLGEQLTGAAIAWLALGASGVLALALRVVERAGRRAWWWLACGALPLIAAAVLLGPWVVEPAFNRFRPLGDAALARRIVALAERSGIPARKVLVADRSRQTRTVNAYVSGLGPSQRIVLWDTTLERLDPDAIVFVTGHEIGHARLGHLPKGVVVAWLGACALLAAALPIVRIAIARRGGRWGVTSAADEAALPLYAAVLGALLLVTQPAACAWSRSIEHEADAYALQLTGLDAAAVRTFVAFAAEDRSDPDPPAWLRALLWTHPALVERVRFAEAWRGRAERR